MIRKFRLCESLRNAISFSSRDWSLASNDAWIYGIVVGWDEAALDEVAKKHGWTSRDVEQLRALQEEFKALKAKEV